MINLFDAAAANDIVSIRRAVLDERQNPNAHHPRAGTVPLQLACQADSRAAVHELLAMGADPDTSYSRNDRVANRVLGNHFPLLYATSSEVALALIRAGANVNRQTDDGDTALSWAILRALPDVVEVLLANGAKKDVEVPWDGKRLAIPALVSSYREHFERRFKSQPNEDVIAMIAKIDAISKVMS